MRRPSSALTRGQSRRAFLKQTATVTLGAASGATMGELWPAYGQQRSGSVTIVVDRNDPIATQGPVDWAIGELRDSLNARGLDVQIRSSLNGLPAGTSCLLVAGAGGSPIARTVLQGDVPLPGVRESLALVRGKSGRQPLLLACGADTRGLVYAVLELADRARFAPDPVSDFKKIDRIVQRPANKVRSVARLFASDVEDKAWFNDRSFWQHYLTELATQRFNRFSLMLGLGYDFTNDIRDAYLHFAYPFLLAVPGYAVRAVPLPDAERDKNLEMLRFISEETVRRGLHFQLGLWTHAYQWVDSPKANYVIEGLTTQTHAPYCRDALTALLKACPSIGGVTLRTHGESGIAEGSYDFWKTVFAGVAQCGRPVEIDLHAKGIDEQTIELALATGMPVNISPKFWAEHMGLGYMQGAIRPLEMPPREPADKGFFAKSSGSRRFLRYGYGDLLREDRRYGILHRIWPGTQRLLLWGSPELAADYGRAASFCGSLGVEWCEPLSFKGRKGSGLPGGRNAYADSSLQPAGGDFEKYAYSYRLWGRLLYDPNCDPDQWRRLLRKQFGGAAAAVEAALQESSRILPLITTAHCPSAANNNYWPEMYTNMAIVDAKRPHPYSDTLSPKRFGTVSSLDPEFFSRVDDFADELVSGQRSAKHSPAWVAATLEESARGAVAQLAAAQPRLSDEHSGEWRRLAADVQIQSGLGYFFAWKFRAAVLFALYEKSGYEPALAEAATAYRRARESWTQMAQAAQPIYRSDVTFGPGTFQRGHWLDRLPAIDADIADLEQLLTEPKASPRSGSELTEEKRQSLQRIVAMVLHPPAVQSEPPLPGFHVPPASFGRAEPLPIAASAKVSHRVAALKALHLRFRRVNQAELWQTAEMVRSGKFYHATIPGEYTDSPFPLQYYFECRDTSGPAWLFPVLKPGWQGQPYFIVRQSSGDAASAKAERI